jgi:hypothetical protein
LVYATKTGGIEMVTQFEMGATGQPLLSQFYGSRQLNSQEFKRIVAKTDLNSCEFSYEERTTGCDRSKCVPQTARAGLAAHALQDGLEGLPEDFSAVAQCL